MLVDDWWKPLRVCVFTFITKRFLQLRGSINTPVWYTVEAFHFQSRELVFHTPRLIFTRCASKAKWRCGCEFPPCPLLALDLASVPLVSTSRAAARQSWVTSPVNDKGRLGVRRRNTEVHKTLSSATEVSAVAVWLHASCRGCLQLFVFVCYISDSDYAGYNIHVCC